MAAQKYPIGIGVGTGRCTLAYLDDARIPRICAAYEDVDVTWPQLLAGHSEEEDYIRRLTVVLKHLRRSAEGQLGPVPHAVLSVPWNASQTQLAVIARSVLRAGFESVEFLEEPHATALSQCYATLGADAWNKHDVLNSLAGQFLIYCELQVNAFCVNLFHVERQLRLCLMNTLSNDTLGAREWDQTILEGLCSEYHFQFGVDPGEQPALLRELKHHLPDVRRQFALHQQGGFEPIDLGDSRQMRFDPVTCSRRMRELARASVSVIEQLLQDAGLTWADCGQIWIGGDPCGLQRIGARINFAAHREAAFIEAKQEPQTLGAANYAEKYLRTLRLQEAAATAAETGVVPIPESEPESLPESDAPEENYAEPQSFSGSPSTPLSNAVSKALEESSASSLSDDELFFDAEAFDEESFFDASEDSDSDEILIFEEEAFDVDDLIAGDDIFADQFVVDEEAEFDPVGPVLGIDLGWETCAAVWIDPEGKLRPVRLEEGEPDFDFSPYCMESAVYFLAPDEIVVGTRARKIAEINPRGFAGHFLEQLGEPAYCRESEDEVEEPLAFEIEGRTFRPEELAAELLGKIRRASELEAGPVERAVICVPLACQEPQRRAILAAGKLAGFSQIEFVEAPVAAALAYGHDLFQLERFQDSSLADLLSDQRILVYDLSDQAFVATLISVEIEGGFQILGSCGDSQTGTRNWDEILLDLVCDRCRQEVGESPRWDLRAMVDLQRKVRYARKSLVHLPRCEVAVAWSGYDLQITIQRGLFEKSCRHLLWQTSNLIQEMLLSMRAGWNYCDHILVTGDGCSLRGVAEHLRNVAQRDIGVQRDPCTALARGAALFAAGKIA